MSSVLGSKWWASYLLVDPPLNDLGVNNQALHDILENGEHNVGGQEGLAQGDPAVGTVIQGPLKPLHGRRLLSVGHQGHEVAGQAATPLAPHRIALVRHGRGADLLRLERLLHFLDGGPAAEGQCRACGPRRQTSTGRRAPGGPPCGCTSVR